MRVAVVLDATNIVENVIMCDMLPTMEGCTCCKSSIAGIGDTFDPDREFSSAFSEAFALETFTPPYIPPPDSTWDDVDTLQNTLFNSTKVMRRIARYETQTALTGQSTSETETKYQELLQYCQDVRDCDNTTYEDPQDALDALNALIVPEIV